MSDRLHFDTEPLPERDRFPAFCEEAVRRYTGLDLATDDPVGFRATIELQRAGSIGIGCISTTRLKSARTRELVRDGDDSLLVALMKRGEAHQTQRENGQRLATGDTIICDCGYPGEFNFLTDVEFWHLKIPRAKITGLLPSFAGFAGIALNADDVARRLLFGYLAGTFNTDWSGGGRAAELLEDHVIGLVALGAGGDALELEKRYGVATVRRAAILHEIEAAMSDPNLSPVIVASRLGITPRYLHLLLEATGRSFSEHLLDERLDRAATLLRNPAQRHRRIFDIAFACGFGDLSHFNRAFRRRFGATPSEVREQARRDGM